jgi:hypothetical protein
MGSFGSKNKKVQHYSAVIYNLKGKEIPKIEDGYYNLGTNRRNKDKRKELIYDENFRIGGSLQEVQAFYNINHITENTVCDIKGKNTILFAPDIDDIAKIPNDLIEALCIFNLLGLRTKAKIVEILDADTMILCFMIPLKFLSEPQFYQHDRKSIESPTAKTHQKQKVLIKSSKPTSRKIQEGGLYVKMDCRLLNIDAAEHDRKEGILATELTKKLYESLNYICYIQCGTMDKYGRLLIDIYEDENYTKYLNYYLVDHPDPKLGVLAERYNGTTKSDYMKNLPKVNELKTDEE